jgi:hypothetical protein
VNDPRAGESPALMADLRSQNKLTLLAVEGMKRSYQGHEEVDALKSQIAALMHADLPADVAEQAKKLDADLTKIGGAMSGPGAFGPGRPATPEPNALHSFMQLNNDYNAMVSMMQVGLDMAPTATRIATWESDCNEYNRTVAAWKNIQQPITDFNAVLGKNQLHAITLEPTKLTDASCSFGPEGGRKKSK